MKNALDEIMALRDLKDFGDVCLAESIGRPNDYYETLKNINQSKY